MRTLRVEFEQSMRQQTVRSMTTKDSVGTLSVKCYETKTGNPKPVDFARLAQKEEKISSLQSSSPEVLICEGTIVCVRKGGQPQIQPSPFWPDSMRTCLLLRTHSDSYLLCTRLSYSIALSIVHTTTTAQLKTTSIFSSVANYKKEDDTIVLDDDVYCWRESSCGPSTVVTLGLLNRD